VLDGVLFPTQIIVTKELDGPEHMWLKSLSGKLKKKELKDLLKQVDELTHDFDKRLADAVLEVSVRANQEIVKELKGDETMCQALLEIMEPEINKIKEQTIKETTDRVAKETADRVAKETADRVAKETADRVAKETADRVAKETADRVAKETAHKEARENAANMLRSGNFSPEEIKKYIPRLSLEEIKALAEELCLNADLNN
jgi:membrane protein involved in colicin uptake